MASQAPSRPQVVGREAEVTTILRWFYAAGPATLVLEGPPGLGKTTVWRAVLGELSDRGVSVLSCAPSEAESHLAYSGLADLLAPHLASVAPALAPPLARALAVALRLEEPVGQPTDETAVARGTLEAIRALGRLKGRVLVAIDDARWLDGPSLTAVLYVARRLEAGDPVRIIATHRSDAPEPVGLPAGSGMERMRLAPLSVGGIHRVVRLHTGISLARPKLLEIHGLTAGNPLHAIELARTIGSIKPVSGGSLADLFAARIGALPAEARRALVLVAASAERSSARLETAWSAGPTASGPRRFADAIGPAVEAGLLTMFGGQVRPAHPLITHVAYEEADAHVRRGIHRALAETASDTEVRALHLGRAVDGTDAKVADAVEAAARNVRSRGARALSAELFERAAAITPAGQDEVGARRRLEAAAAWYESGDTHRVEALLEPMIAAGPAGALRAEARWRLGIALDEAGRWQEATVHWRDALVEADDLALSSQVRCSLAITAMYTESTQAGVTWADSAVDEAERSGDASALARALTVDAFLLVMAGREGGQPLMERALQIESTIDEHLGEWSPSALAGECARHTGDARGALLRYASVLERATARGDASVGQWAAYGLASAAILNGDLQKASMMADLVFDIADQTDIMRIPARSLLAQVAALRGEIDRARGLVQEAISMARAGDEATHLFGAYVALGAVEICAGGAPAAAAAYHHARALADELGLAHASALRSRLLEVETAAGSGELAKAAEALAAFDRRAGASPRGWLIPLRRRAAAALLAAQGELEQATTELEAAVTDPEALGPDVGRSLIALAATLRRRRLYRRARATATRARDLFEAMGCPPLVAMADAELARIPGRRVPTEGQLSPAEVRIAELVAAGLSNREVATELVLSVKTVEVTLTRVYAKLGIRSRSELAARSRELAAATTKV